MGAGLQGWNPGTSWRKQCPDSRRTDGQAEEVGDHPCPLDSEQSLEGQAGAGRRGMSEADGLVCNVGVT